MVPRPANSLPEGIAFTPGQMLVEFAGVEDLLTKLYGVAQSAAGDFDWFQATVECATRQPDGTVASALDFF